MTPELKEAAESIEFCLHVSGRFKEQIAFTKIIDALKAAEADTARLAELLPKMLFELEDEHVESETEPCFACKWSALLGQFAARGTQEE